MAKLLKKNRYIFGLLIIVINLFCIIFLLGNKSSDVDLTSAMTSSNYIVLILNNLYILYIYIKTKKIKSIYDKLICRLGKRKFFSNYIINCILDIIVYFIIIYIPIYLKFGVNLSYINFLIIFIFLNFFCFIFEELISMLVFITKNGSKYIIIPISINLLFYYYLVPIIIGQLIH